MKTLYYVIGSHYRGEEVIGLLEEKGGVNKYKYSGVLDEAIYYIDHENNIDRVYECETNRYKFITHYGTELTLPKLKVYKWEDIEDERGTLLEGARFPTDQQYASVVAASKIAQIRCQGKNVYGEIPAPGEHTVNICCVGASVWVSTGFEGGLLKFENIEKAELFLKNNESLVEEYLKTF